MVLVNPYHLLPSPPRLMNIKSTPTYQYPFKGNTGGDGPQHYYTRPYQARHQVCSKNVSKKKGVRTHVSRICSKV